MFKPGDQVVVRQTGQQGRVDSRWNVKLNGSCEVTLLSPRPTRDRSGQYRVMIVSRFQGELRESAFFYRDSELMLIQPKQEGASDER
jgi:hypothetical protein